MMTLVLMGILPCWECIPIHPACNMDRTLATQTEATVPSDRTRTTVGVGERTAVTVTPAPVAECTVSWSITGGGSIAPDSGNSTTFTAHDRASSPTITAMFSDGSSRTISYTVIEPSGGIIEQNLLFNVFHIYGFASVGFKGTLYITPTNVSFYNIEIIEGYADGVGTGWYAFQNGIAHAPSASWVAVDAVVAGKGSQVLATDTIQAASDNHTPYIDGTFTWAIPWIYRVGLGVQKQFTTMNHVATINSLGTMFISKGGTTISRALYDQTTNY